jgi:predicted nucleic acid-binding protein
MRAEPAVIETNVVVSGLLTSLGASPTARILDGMLVGAFRFLLSVELLAEYRAVLLRQKIRRRHGLSPKEVDVLLTEIAANGTFIDVEAPAGAIRGDDHIWRILAAMPCVLVTGDKRLARHAVGRARVMGPREYAEMVSG